MLLNFIMNVKKLQVFLFNVTFDSLALFMNKTSGYEINRCYKVLESFTFSEYSEGLFSFQT